MVAGYGPDRAVSRRTQLALALAAGVLDCLGFVGFGLFPLSWVAKVPALRAARGETPRRALLLGLAYGVVAHLGGYYWLYHMLIDFGGLPAVASFGVLLFLATYLGLVFAILIWCVRRAERDLGVAPVWSLAVAYPAVELVFPVLFPYNIGASQYRFTAIAQIVEVTGLLGLTALIGMVNGAVYELWDARLARRRVAPMRLAVPAAAFLLVLAYGLVRIPQVDAKSAAARRVTVGLIQTNLGARDKEGRRFEFIDRHKQMTRELIEAHPEVELVVWPETAFNAFLHHEAKDLRRELEPQRPMVLGALTASRKEGRWVQYNTLLSVSATGEVLGRFDKVRLLAFGETIPLVGAFPRLREWLPRSNVLEPGRTFQSLRVGDFSLLPMICYEDILPDFLREMWRRGGPASALVNATNDSWYGDSHQPLIHLALATFRSIEARRALIRSTNTGISAFVDPVGRIAKRTGQWTREVLVDRVPLIEDGSTGPYLRVGDLLGWLCLGLTAAGLVRAHRAARRRAAEASRPPPARRQGSR
jgi:apolipoprotein N-acyltransferase